MPLKGFNFKKEIIVFAAIWIIISVLIYKIFPGNPYQGQSVIIFWSSVINSSFYPSLFVFSIYLALWSIIEIITGWFNKRPVNNEIKSEPVE